VGEAVEIAASRGRELPRAEVGNGRERPVRAADQQLELCVAIKIRRSHGLRVPAEFEFRADDARTGAIVPENARLVLVLAARNVPVRECNDVERAVLIEIGERDRRRALCRPARLGRRERAVTVSAEHLDRPGREGYDDEIRVTVPIEITHRQ
jgi:hypothetical protein